MNDWKMLDFQVNYKGRSYKVIAIPQHSSAQDIIVEFKITLNCYPMGILIFKANKWLSNNIIDQELIDIIGSYIKAQRVPS